MFPTLLRFSAALFYLQGLLPAFAQQSTRTPSPQAAPQYTIRIAILPPRETSYGIAVKKFLKKIEYQSRGRVHFELSPGGTLGDEPQVAALLRAGELEAAGITGVGLGHFASEVRILELPRLCRSYKEIDYLIERYTPYFAKALERNNMKLLGLTTYGGIELWSTFPIATGEDALSGKLWIWKGDPLAEAIATTVEARTVVTLPVTEVISALREGRVDVVYNTAAGLIMLGWYPYVTHVVKIEGNLTRAVAGFIIRLDVWNSLPFDVQELIQREIPTVMNYLKEWIGRDELIAHIALAKRGMRLSPISAETMHPFDEQFQKVWYALVDKLYPRSLLDSILADLAEFRARQATGGKPAE